MDRQTIIGRLRFKRVNGNDGGFDPVCQDAANLLAYGTTVGTRTRIFEAINVERDRQDDKFGFDPPSILPGEDEWRKLAVLAEEFGEVANALLETDFGNDTQAHVEEELIQVAAVAVAWVEFNRKRRA